MREKPIDSSGANWNNPVYSENQKKINFREKYQARKEMSFEYGKFEYLDLSPEEKKGQDLFIATGTPWSWELTEDLAFHLFNNGHRITAIAHPDRDLKKSSQYRPEVERPAAIREFFKQKNLEQVIAIAHSFGFLDIIRQGSEGLSGVVAINPAGLSKNSPLAHSWRAIKNVKIALTKNAGTEEERYNRKIIKDLFSQSPIKSVKEILDVGSAEMSQKVKSFANIPITVLRNTDDTLVPIDQLNDQNFIKMESGGNHLGPFIYQDQMEMVLKAVRDIEQGIKKS